MAWRYRQCPKCERVFPAGELTFEAEYGPYWTDGKAARRCPRCGFMGYTRDFKVVRQLGGKAPPVVSYAPVQHPPMTVLRCRVCTMAMGGARTDDICGWCLRKEVWGY